MMENIVENTSFISDRDFKAYLSDGIKGLIKIAALFLIFLAIDKLRVKALEIITKYLEKFEILLRRVNY